ncbi:ABC transporter permease [bacterium]|nr:ABC transporter permease [bacterium]MCI7148555.1 ABC transporter permease [bacterium]MDY2886901.1 ABC transporter permease [Bariatricus sp.]MDY4503684.1 ABC transporter permease [Bariatricus sp.]
MRELCALVKRDTKLFFKDKGMFFTSLITPMILLVLYASFLSSVYEDTFRSSLEAAGASVSDKLIGGCVGGELASSLLAVCCVTVAFCSNMLMVQDKVSGARRDLTISPVKSSTLALGYYISTLISTLLVCYAATAVCLLYVSKVGWYLTMKDVLLLWLDVFLLVMFGTALSSIINHFLTSQGQISAVGTIVSAGYGFLCGAYMPISQFSDGLQKVISFLPGTYGTSLLRNHALRGVFEEMSNQNFPSEVIEAIKDSVDCNLYFFGTQVSESMMYMILVGTVLLLLVIYVLLNMLHGTKEK